MKMAGKQPVPPKNPKDGKKPPMKPTKKAKNY